MPSALDVSSAAEAEVDEVEHRRRPGQRHHLLTDRTTMGIQQGAVRLFPHRDHHHVSAVGDPPGPEVGALLGLLQLVALFVIGHVYQRHSAVVLLRLLVHQGEDAARSGQGHDDGVELLGDLVDGVGEALGQLQERRTGLDF